MQRLNSNWIAADKVMDYIPIVSNINALGNVAIKVGETARNRFNPAKGTESRVYESANPYRMFVAKEKSKTRIAIALFLPVLGSLILLAWDQLGSKKAEGEKLYNTNPQLSYLYRPLTDALKHDPNKKLNADEQLLFNTAQKYAFEGSSGFSEVYLQLERALYANKFASATPEGDVKSPEIWKVLEARFNARIKEEKNLAMPDAKTINAYNEYMGVLVEQKNRLNEAAALDAPHHQKMLTLQLSTLNNSRMKSAEAAFKPNKKETLEAFFAQDTVTPYQLNIAQKYIEDIKVSDSSFTQYDDRVRELFLHSQQALNE